MKKKISIIDKIIKHMVKSIDLSIIPYDDRSQQHLSNSNLPDWLPKHEFLMLIIAPAGSGKTTLLLNILLRIYKQYWHQIFLFSPTIHNDGKWEHLKKERKVLLPMMKGGLHESFLLDSKATKGGGGEHDKEEGLPDWLKKKEQSKSSNKKEQWTYMNPFEQQQKPLSKKAIFSKRHGPPVIHRKQHPPPVDNQKQMMNEEMNLELLKQKYLESEERRQTLQDQLQKPMTPLEMFLWQDLKKQLFKRPHEETMETSSKGSPSSSTSQLQKTSEKKKKKEQQVHENEMFEEYDEETLKTLMKKKDDIVKDTKTKQKDPHSLKWMNEVERSIFVFDDMVGSGLFSNKRDNAFKRLTVRRRHLFSSVIGVTQAYREIPKTTRTNANALIMFHIDNEEELSTIYEEFPMGLKWKQWMAMVDWATEEPYSFIMFNTQQSDPNLRIIKGFDQPLPLDWIKQTFVY